MLAKRHLSAILVLALIALLSTACGPKPQPEEPATSAPSMTPEEPEPEPAVEPEPEEVREWQAPEEPEETRLSASQLQAQADRFNREGALVTVYFETDKSELTSDARRILAANAAWLRGHPDFGVLVAGHCDERNTEEYNLALGERRAEAVRRYLASLGVGDGRIETISYGEERPAAQGHTESAWSQNRRAEFEVRPL